MNKIKLYKNEELTTEIKILDGKSAIKLYSKMLKGDIYENYVFSTNRKFNPERSYIFVIDYLDDYGVELPHPEIYIVKANFLFKFLSLTDFTKGVIE